MKNPNALFNRSFVVNLTRRADRLERFENAWNAAFRRSRFYSRRVPTFRRFEAFDGSNVGAPPSWTAGDGAFGCCLSHLTLWARILSDGIGPDETAAIFEDDAVFAADFADAARRLAERVPDDADLFYLGGEHLLWRRPAPKPIAPGVVRAVNVNRLHAYVATGRGLKKLVAATFGTAFHMPRRTSTPSGGWENHLDYEIGRLTERGVLTVYAAEPWLVGQDAGTSDVSTVDRDAPDFFGAPFNK